MCISAKCFYAIEALEILTIFNARMYDNVMGVMIIFLSVPKRAL